MSEQQLLINGMIRVLAGTIVLRCKSRFFAWSTGEDQNDHIKQVFYSDYQALDLLCDDLAIRIGLLGGDVPGSYSVLAGLSSIKEEERPSTPQMIQSLLRDHDQLIADCRFVLLLGQERSDGESATVLLKCIEEHTHCALKLRELQTPSVSTS